MTSADTPSLTLLHLSDLHFGQARGEGRVHFDQQKVVSELRKDAAEMREKLGSPDAVLVTGDIAFSATSEQYRQADNWLRALAHAVGVSPEKVWLVPGNHDVDRNQATKPLGRKNVHLTLRGNPLALEDYFLKDNESEFEKDLWPKFQPYAEFARPWAAPTLSAAEPFWKQERETSLGKLVLVGLNSCLLSLDNTDKKENLALSKAQLHRLLDALPQDALTLALMHHPPDWLADGIEVLKELHKHPHVLFTGHVHELGGGIQRSLGGYNFIQIKAGAAHASPSEPGQHSYAWIRLSKAGLEWYPRAYSGGWNEFRADADRLDEGKLCQFLEISALPKNLRGWLAPAPAPAAVSTPAPAPVPTPTPTPTRDPLLPKTWEKALAYF
ncbi:MAG: metallophosphoesterase family protein, partial [Myxococcota bacterium]